jgi:uncharacterized protein DUF4153
MEELEERHPWPARAVLLMVLGGVGGFVFHQLTKGPQAWQWTDAPLRLGAAAFLAAGGIAFAFSLERRRWLWSAAFGLVVGLVVGGVTWRNGSGSAWGSNEAWQLFSAVLAVTIAVPLFQTVRDAARPRLDYQALHAHSWTDALLWAAAWAFVLAVFLLAYLLGQLFALIGLRQIETLLGKPWFDWTLAGAAFGAAVGLLRERDRMLVVLQRVVTAIVAVLTPALALGLVLFVLALPFTGLTSLWSETKQTTPILLACILAAFVLTNATIGNSAEEEARAPVLRYAALALALVMLPLGIVAAVSIGKRVAQYGLTPDRLWAITFVAFALACGLAYLATILLRRRLWPEGVRRSNIRLAIGICAVALFLALPLVSFGAISAGNQLWRIRTGRIAPEKADWIALRYDFGPAGQRAVERLAAQAPDPRTRSLAHRILEAKERPGVIQAEEEAKQAVLPHIIDVLPRPAPVPPAVTNLLFRVKDGHGLCAEHGRCMIQWEPGATVAIAMLDSCAPDPRVKGDRSAGFCGVDTQVIEQVAGAWREAEQPPTGWPGDLSDRRGVAAVRGAIAAGRVELRTIPVRQVFIDGKPVGALVR